MIDGLLKLLSDNMYPQLKTWEQLLQDTNSIFRWDRLVKEEYQILYEKGVEYARRKEYQKAGETFYKAATLSERKKQTDVSYKMLYCAWECALWCGNPEPLVGYTKEMYDIYKGKTPQWLIERLGNCGIAHICFADIQKSQQEALQIYKLGGWLFTQYFDKTGDYKDFENEWIYYVFYGVACYKTGGKECLLSYAYDMKKHVPDNYVEKVLRGWNIMVIK